MFSLRTILAVALLAVLAACAAMPVGSLVQLARVDMLKTDLQALRVAVWLPSELVPLPDGVVMTLTLRRDGAVAQSVDMTLAESADPDALGGFPPSSGVYRAYRLAPADIVRFDDVRRSIAAGGAPGSLEIAVGVHEFCRAAALPVGAVRASTYLRTAETGPAWVTLIDGFDLRSDPRIAAGLEAVTPC